MLTDRRRGLQRWLASGEAFVWLNASAIGLALLMALGLLGLLAVRGVSYFWPAPVALVGFASPVYGTRQLYGQPVDRDRISLARYREATGRAAPAGGARDPASNVARILVKTGNRRVNPPAFRWLYDHEILSVSYPANAVVLERRQWGQAFGRIESLTLGDVRYEGDAPGLFAALDAELGRIRALEEQLDRLQSAELAPLSAALQNNRRRVARITSEPERSQLLGEQQALERHFAQAEAQRRQLAQLQEGASLRLDIGDGTSTVLPVSQLVRVWRPNAMSAGDKAAHYFQSLALFLSADPREGNTEGGVFPAIFGTVLMVLIMSVLVAPIGVLAAVYLHEYAEQGRFVQFVRIAVNNLAGVPSIVYGVFGLGFFVYVLGGSIDSLFFADRQPAATFGSPGLLWASLTLALLTLPVVIVSAEEGLNRVPRSLREGSLALGATQAETLFKVVLPMASPAILTGIILAVARAAGEVAPLMLVGVVKLAPALPVDGIFPYVHLDQQFMHLGFHIFDLGFQNSNVEASGSLVYATALLLVMIVLVLNLAAMVLRNRLEKRYKGQEL